MGADQRTGARIAFDRHHFRDESFVPKHWITALSLVCRDDNLTPFDGIVGLDQAVDVIGGHAGHVAEQNQYRIDIWRQCLESALQ